MAESQSTATEAQDVLLNLENTLKLAEQQIDDTPDRENENFNSETFWANFTAATKLISHEATKFCMIFNNEEWPDVEVCKSLSENIERTCLSFLATFVTLPKTRGRIFHGCIQKYVGDILRKMSNLCEAIRCRRPSLLQQTGELWEHCAAVERLPKDNRDAVLMVVRQEYEMLEDASQELMNSMENEDDDPAFELSLISPPNGIQIPPQRWSDSDRSVLLPCSGLVKASKACLKKTGQAIASRGDGTSEGGINELDGVASIVANSSQLADDFVLSVYPPMNHSAAREQATLLRNNSKQLLHAVKHSHFCGATDETWIEFLEKAVDHNWERISDLVLAD